MNGSTFVTFPRVSLSCVGQQQKMLEKLKIASTDNGSTVRLWLLLRANCKNMLVHFRFS